MEPGQMFFIKYWKTINNQSSYPVLFDERENVLFYVIDEIGNGELRVKNFNDKTSPEFQINRNELLTIEEYSRKINENSKKFQRPVNEISEKFQTKSNENSNAFCENDKSISSVFPSTINNPSVKYLEAINRIANKCKQTSNENLINKIDSLVALANIAHAEGNKPELNKIYQQLKIKQQQQQKAPVAKQFRRPPTPLMEEISNHHILFSVLLNKNFIKTATKGFYKDIYELPETCPRDIAKALLEFRDKKANINNGIKRPDGQIYKVALLSSLIKKYKAYAEIKKQRRKLVIVIISCIVFMAGVVLFNTTKTKPLKLNTSQIENYLSSYEQNYEPIISDWRRDTITNYISVNKFKDSTEVIETIKLFNNKTDW